MVLLALLVGCRCQAPTAPSEPHPVVAPDHFGEWDRLVRATTSGDVQTAKVVARDLTDGASGLDDGTGRIGGALGYLQLASDPADLIDGVVPAAAGCGECHATQQVPAPQLPPWTHHQGAQRAVASLVWSDPSPPPPAGDEVLQALSAAWTRDDPEERVAAVLQSCQDCHVSEE